MEWFEDGEMDVSQHGGMHLSNDCEEGLPNDCEEGLPNDCEVLETGLEGMEFSTSVDASVHTPNKRKEKKEAPQLGMVFKSVDDDAKSFYIEYGQQEGFGVRVRTTDRKQHGSDVVTSLLLVCSREGVHDKKENNSGVNLGAQIPLDVNAEQ